MPLTPPLHPTHVLIFLFEKKGEAAGGKKYKDKIHLKHANQTAEEKGSERVIRNVK